MAGRPKARKRKVDVEKMTLEQAKKLESVLSAELVKIYDEANEKANKLLNIYGLEVVLSHKIVKESEKNTIKSKIKQMAKQ